MSKYYVYDKHIALQCYIIKKEKGKKKIKILTLRKMKNDKISIENKTKLYYKIKINIIGNKCKCLNKFLLSIYFFYNILSELTDTNPP